MATLSDFDDIRPYSDEEVRPALEALLDDRQFKRILHGLVSWLPYSVMRWLLRMSLKGIHGSLDFQLRFMKWAVRAELWKYSDGCTFDNDPTNTWDRRYTYVSNHRDIVLDSAILALKLVEDGSPTTCEIAIGDNLLIYPWIENFVRINKAFIIRRSLPQMERKEAARHRSQYMHFAINEKKEHIWMAQREGRAKDSDDRTQESLLKMFALGYDGKPIDGLRNMNIVPLTISYEYDPCDFLKATEFQQKRDNPNWKKSKQDDLDNMKTGILGRKGRIHYATAPCINTWLEEMEGLEPQELYAKVAQRIDRNIHRNYRIYANNCIALDRLEGSKAFASKYSDADVRRFDEYLAGQLAKVTLPDKDDEFLMERMLTMYAKPLRNHIAAMESDD